MASSHADDEGDAGTAMLNSPYQHLFGQVAYYQNRDKECSIIWINVRICGFRCACTLGVGNSEAPEAFSAPGASNPVSWHWLFLANFPGLIAILV
jgi:hypothetical protein